jgi:hypothetical protein
VPPLYTLKIKELSDLLHAHLHYMGAHFAPYCTHYVQTARKFERKNGQATLCTVLMHGLDGGWQPAACALYSRAA